MYGGLGPSTPCSTDFNAHPAIIDGSAAAGGQPAKHVATIEQKTNVRLDGFAITGGDASGVALNDWPATAGGGIYCSRLDETAVIANCRAYGNSADDSGGGIACVGYRGGSLFECNPPIENCIVTGNYGGLGAGGILCIVGASPAIVNTIVAENGCTGVADRRAAAASKPRTPPRPPSPPRRRRHRPRRRRAAWAPVRRSGAGTATPYASTPSFRERRRGRL